MQLVECEHCNRFAVKILDPPELTRMNLCEYHVRLSLELLWDDIRPNETAKLSAHERVLKIMTRGEG